MTYRVFIYDAMFGALFQCVYLQFTRIIRDSKRKKNKFVAQSYRVLLKKQFS